MVDLEDARARAWVEVSRVCDAIAWIAAPPGMRTLRTPRDKIHKTIVEGASADEVIEVLRWLSAAVTDGREPRDHWSPHYIFGGFYDRLRQLAVAPDTGAPGESLAQQFERLKAKGVVP